jgi:DNA-directed RNA polymerase subunit K/omega
MKKPSKLSRGTEIDTEQCVANVGSSRFDLVLIASARAREIAKKHRDDGNTSSSNFCVSALLDVQSKSVGREYLNKV